MNETEMKEMERIPVEVLWFAGIDTPNGVHYCFGGCSSDELDISCVCDENKAVREELIELMEDYYLHNLTQLMRFGITATVRRLRQTSPVQDFINAQNDYIVEHPGGLRNY